MKILYVGDVMAEPGLELIEKLLPELRRSKGIDCVIAQAENVTLGRGISSSDFKRLKHCGVDFCSGGNHSLDQKSIFPMLADLDQPIIRPANYPTGTPGLGWKYAKCPAGKILVISLMGQTVGKSASQPIENPLKIVDGILESQNSVKKVATVVNFHGDYSSEKVIIGHYLDGRVTAVIGDHWHVPTADARVLEKGTAHITDVGMCGILDSSLGVSFDSVVPRWRDGKITRNVLESKGLRQFNAVLVTVNSAGLADAIEQIQLIL